MSKRNKNRVERIHIHTTWGLSANIEFRSEERFASRSEVKYDFSKKEVKRLRPFIESLQREMIEVAKEGLQRMDLDVNVDLEEPESGRVISMEEGNE